MGFLIVLVVQKELPLTNPSKPSLYQHSFQREVPEHMSVQARVKVKNNATLPLKERQQIQSQRPET